MANQVRCFGRGPGIQNEELSSVVGNSGEIGATSLRCGQYFFPGRPAAAPDGFDRRQVNALRRLANMSLKNGWSI